MANERRNYVPLAICVGLVVLCTLGILINRRPIGDIILMIVGSIALLSTIGHYLVLHWARQRRVTEAAQARRDEADAVWSSYSRLDGADWVIGVERLPRGDLARRIDNWEMYRWPDGPPNLNERLDAEGEAIARAADFNGRRTP